MTDTPFIPTHGRFNGISIPQKWNGVVFRSRLEARWAIFFESLRPALPYEYEPELIATPYGPYLPDFWLPTIHTFWIVKGEPMDKREQDICYWLMDHYGVCIAEGQIPDTFLNWDVDQRLVFFKDNPGSSAYQLEDGTWECVGDYPMWFTQSFKTGKYGVQWSGCWNRNDGEEDGDRTAGEETDNIKRALAIAKGHRFDTR
jgi:hypothetical protein